MKNSIRFLLYDIHWSKVEEWFRTIGYKCNSGYHKQFIFDTRNVLITLEHYDKNVCIEEKNAVYNSLVLSEGNTGKDKQRKHSGNVISNNLIL